VNESGEKRDGISTVSGIDRSIENYIAGVDDAASAERVVGAGLASLPALRDFLHRDLDIDKAEAVEFLLKRVIGAAFDGRISGATARELAVFQKDLGLILKYKPYTVKAASPLGYSIFLQNEGEGFSYQRHVTHKTEVFHILEVKPGGFVFLCQYEDWVRHYDRASIDSWLQGEPHSFYDSCRFTPTPGDVFVISELGVVHTVVGCVLEEYATVSTDMVERLHDQNAGKPIPPHFDRAFSEASLRKLRLPASHRRVELLEAGRPISPIAPVAIEGGELFELEDSFVTASTIRMAPRAVGSVRQRGGHAALLRVFSGAGSVALADSTELGRLDEMEVPFASGETLLVPPGIYYRISNGTDEPLEISEHRIRPEVAFV
jgi:mannose-6-phosphate isomerase-like protein (cupin superfamily)